jgi:hypothetical protein
VHVCASMDVGASTSPVAIGVLILVVVFALGFIFTRLLDLVIPPAAGPRWSTRPLVFPVLRWPVSCIPRYAPPHSALSTQLRDRDGRGPTLAADVVTAAGKMHQVQRSGQHLHPHQAT